MAYFSVAIICILILYVIIIYFIVDKKRKNIKNFYYEVDELLDRQSNLVFPLCKSLKTYFPAEKDVIDNALSIQRTVKSSRNVNDRLEYILQINYIISQLFIMAQKYGILEKEKTYLKHKEAFIKNVEKIEFQKDYYDDLVYDYNYFISIFPNLFFAKILGIKKI